MAGRPFGNVRSGEWLARRNLGRIEPTIFFHARDVLARNLVAGHFKLLGAFAAHAAERGWHSEIVAFDPVAYEVAAEGGHLHVFMEDRPVFGANIFHCVPGYLRGYWFFDELATRHNASHRLARFHPEMVDAAAAQALAAELYSRHVEANFSKFAQPMRGTHPVAAGALVFFAQGFARSRTQRWYMTVPEMAAAAVAGRGGRPLYIRPHPQNTAAERAELMRLHDPAAGVHVTDAGLHDLLAAAACTISVSSAAAFEGFLHGKPAVLGGQTDFHHNAVTVTDPAALAAAIGVALGRAWPHAAFLHWFLKETCVEDRTDALPRLLDRVHRKGYAFADTAGRGFYLGPPA